MGSCCSSTDATATRRVSGADTNGTGTGAGTGAPTKHHANGSAGGSATGVHAHTNGPNGPAAGQGQGLDSTTAGTATPGAVNLRLSQNSQNVLSVGASPTLSVGTLSGGFSGSAGGSPGVSSGKVIAATDGAANGQRQVTPPRTADGTAVAGAGHRHSDGSAPSTAGGLTAANLAAHNAASATASPGGSASASATATSANTPVLGSGAAPGTAAGNHLRANTTATATPDSGRPAFPAVVITTDPGTSGAKPVHPFGLPADPTPTGTFGGPPPLLAASTMSVTSNLSINTPSGSVGSGGPAATPGSHAAPPHYPALHVTTTDTPPGSRTQPGGGGGGGAGMNVNVNIGALPRPPLHGQPGSLLSVPYLAPGGTGDSSARASTPSHSAGSPKSGMSLMSNDSDPATDRAHHQHIERPVPELSISRVPMSPVSATAPLAPG